MSDKLPKGLFICSAVTCMLLWVFIKLTMIEPATGFYTGSSPLITFFNLLLFLSCLLLFVLGLFQKREWNLQETIWNLPLLRFLSILCGAGAIASAGYFGWLQYDYYLSTFNFAFDLIDLIGWVAGFAGRVFFFVLMPVVSGFLWIRLGVRPPSASLSPNPYLCLAPVLWQIGLSVSFFMSFTSMRAAADQRFGITQAVLAVPFLLAFARLTSKIDPARGMRYLRLFGLVFALFALVSAGGALAAMLAGRRVTVALPLVMELFFYPVLALYAVVFLFSVKAAAAGTDTVVMPPIPDPKPE